MYYCIFCLKGLWTALYKVELVYHWIFNVYKVSGLFSITADSMSLSDYFV